MYEERETRLHTIRTKPVGVNIAKLAFRMPKTGQEDAVAQTYNKREARRTSLILYAIRDSNPGPAD